MITYLKYNVKFSSTGKTFSQNLNFKPGLTVITGANEKGKSLILEMIEYAWFGVSALRGQWSDYETLEVDMTWQTKGETYSVSRHGTTQSLNKNKALGATAVNKAILNILGINLDVFRIACSAKQGELDKLTARMRPTERRRMVDEVIGLNQLEIVERLCRTEANADKRLRDDLSKRLIEPTLPEEPDGYIASSILEARLHDQIRIEAEREQLLRLPEPVLPQEPIKGEFEDDVEEYEQQRQIRTTERTTIERTLRSIPSTSFARSDIEYAREYYDQQVLGPVPTISRSDANKWLEAWAEIERLDKSVQCPRCELDFIPGEGEVDKVDQPPMTHSQIMEQLDAMARWEGRTPKVFPTKPVMDFNELQGAELAIAQEKLKQELEDQLKSLPEMPSREQELVLKLTWEKDNLTYKHQLETYMDQLTEWSDNQVRLRKLPAYDPGLEKNLVASQFYEEQKRRYDADRVVFEATISELSDLNDRIESYNNGAEALKFVRSQVKQHLVPSLNKVASFLLSEMSNGQRTKIVVDEDFEVYADGQPVRTLSGSGVSLVNLALRIALGQVLTQKIIPIFLADEIDHDMDPVRAAATHSAIKNLTKMLDQIIVVSHKPIDGDNTIGV